MEYLSDWEAMAGISQELWGLARNELEQAAETGRDVTALRAKLEGLTFRDDKALSDLYAQILAAPPPVEWPFFEGSQLDDIVSELPEEAAALAIPDKLEDRIKGAWFGRVIGNMMGKPLEAGPTRRQIRSHLEAQQAYPLIDYVPFEEGADLENFSVYARFFGVDGVTKGRIHGSIRDDDVDYTILGLHILETYGASYTSWDVAHEWLWRFPVYQVYTAERATYQNLVREIPLDAVGEHRNPYREWIGALIRADIFGYVAAGDPRRAALLAYNDASLSHRANGIYGAMWAAALVSSAFVAQSPEDSIVRSLEHVPARSRMAIEINTVLEDFRNGDNWEAAFDKLDARWSRMSFVHTINNAGALTAAILWGGGDFALTAGLAAQSGLDTDSIGATAGSWAGAYLGYSALPQHLILPLEDRCRSGIFGFGESRISDYAHRTLAVMGKIEASQ